MAGKNKSRRNRRVQKTTARNEVSRFGLAPVLPPNRRIRLAYAERIGLVEPTEASGIHSSFSLNSLYDPNSGGIGSQPIGFDQLSAMYGQFRVWNVTAKITCCNNTANAAMAVVFGTYQPAAPANPDAWFCQTYSKSVDLEPLGGRSNKVMVARFSIPKVLGLTDQQYRSDMDFVGTSSGNPTRQAYLIVGFRSVNPVRGAVSFYIQMSYEVEFSQPIALPLS